MDILLVVSLSCFAVLNICGALMGFYIIRELHKQEILMRRTLHCVNKFAHHVGQLEEDMDQIRGYLGNEQT